LRISHVGATVGIVYGRTDATMGTGRSAPALWFGASGSVKSRAYIITREPAAASADFLSVGFR